MWQLKEKVSKGITVIKDAGLYGKACGAMLKGDTLLAIRLFEELEEKDPEVYKQNPMSKSPLGVCYTSLQRYGDALKVFDPIYENLDTRYQKENWDSLNKSEAKIYESFLYHYGIALKKLNQLAKSDMVYRDYEIFSKMLRYKFQ